jgi:hypothetical protein
MKFYSIFLSLFLTSCASGYNQNIVPEFDVSPEQMHSLREKFTRSKYDILCLLMIDRKGHVVKSKLVLWNKHSVNEDTANKFTVQMTRALTFSEDNDRESEYLLLPYGFNVKKRFDFHEY